MNSIRDNSSFLRIAAICGILAGMATFLIWLLPTIYGRPSGFEARLALQSNTLYMLRHWVSFINVFFIIIASIGLALFRFNRYPGYATTGLFFLLIYGVLEFGGRSVMIFVREGRWASQWLATTDLEIKASLAQSIQQFDQIWGGLFVVLLVCFIIASLCFWRLTWKGDGLEHWLSLIILAGGITAVITLGARFTGYTWLRNLALWSYPLVMPLSRLLLGIWLLQVANATDSKIYQ